MCMDFVATGWYTVKKSRVDKTCRDLEIPLVLIRMGVTGLKTTELVYLLDLFGGMEKRGSVI